MPKPALAGAPAALALAAILTVTASAVHAADYGDDAWAVATAQSYGVAPPASSAKPIVDLAYLYFIVQVDRGAVRRVTVADGTVNGEFATGTPFRTTTPQDAGLIPRLLDHHVRINAVGVDDSAAWFEWFILWPTLLLLVGMAGYTIWSLNRQAKGGGRVLGLGQGDQARAEGSEGPGA